MKRIIITMLFSLMCLVAALAMAQSSGDGFEITKSSIDSGGGTSSGGGFSLTGTIGQPEAQRQVSVGEGFILAGGFWADARDVIFTNGFESN